MKSFNSTDPKLMANFKFLRSLAVAICVATSLVSIVVFAQETLYEKGQRQLDNQEFQLAQETFTSMAEADAAQQDAALYWLAYAQFKSRQNQKALNTIEKLNRDHQKSRWIKDAQALKVEIQDKAGLTVDIDNQEMKLYALDSLMNSPNEKSLQLLKNIVTGGHSDRVKKRALFVLSQRDDSAAVEVIEALAKDSTNASLQVEAIHVLGISGASGAIASLKEIYRATDDERVKLKAIQSFMIADASDELLALSYSEKSPRLKSELIRTVGVMSNTSELLKMYKNPLFKDFRYEILEGIAIGDGADALYQLIESEDEQELVVAAVERMGIIDASETGDYLAKIYRAKDSNAVRSAVIRALFIQSNVKGLIDIVKVEDDPQLKREALRNITLMDSDEALQYFEGVFDDRGAQQ